ncbi:ferric reductase transmembrane component 7 [Ophiostoma piceae UAMH 11346]|uniref:ferric-chelate reductase (NADPH) n=1 Tax=Ophiostoma piceae (strain UAMH 11346) TaxID=1262450 RepID=S3BYJ4_OPHP1|nr:ferric reductase transmembrane component 7 [Ophiostoma piceae UAMH 11346]
MASPLMPEPPSLARRIYIPLTATSPAGLVEANTVDPWSKSGKYALAWTYFAAALTGSVLIVRLWHYWQDKIRQAIYKQEVEEHYQNLYLAEPEWDQSAATATGIPNAGNGTPHTAQTVGHASNRHFFPEEYKAETAFRPTTHMSSIGFINDTLALFRWIFYRPIPDLVIRKYRLTFSSLAVLMCGFIALAFTTLYCFLPQPLYWESIRFGSPPLAIRSGMIAVAMTPWIIATSTKTNVLTLVTGIGPERLNVLHRWAGYLCLFLSLVHAVPFYVQPVWKDGGLAVFQSLFPNGMIIYGTGIACLVPLIWLCVASLPIIRRVAYEAFVMLHIPVGCLYVGLLFWHTKNYLNSWSYLYASVGIFAVCQVVRLRNLNWSRPWRMSFFVGDEAAITLMTENAIKITIPTQMRWKPGQYVYLRMPGISLFENHPFTVSSLCSEDFPSAYGDAYRDCVLVFRPYGGFTRKVLETAIEKGPFVTYRAFLDGPYGGMRRELAAFDTCILIAGGSGITSLMSQLLNLIKRMRDGKAITKKIVVVWALKRLEAMDWFREELRICRESAPPESVTCKFFVTSATRAEHRNQHLGHLFATASELTNGQPTAAAPSTAGAAGPHHQPRAPRPLSNLFHDRLDGFVAGIASKRHSALIASEAEGDPERERELRAEEEDRITALPQQKYLQPYQQVPPPLPPPPLPHHMSTTPDESLRQLEGQEPSSEEKHPQGKSDSDGNFHFAPHPRADAPHFNLVPPSAMRKAVEAGVEHPRQEDEDVHHNGGHHDGHNGDHNDGHSGDHTGMRPPELAHLRTDVGGVQRRPDAGNTGTRPVSTFGPPSGFDFGFPETPTEFQKSLMRFAFPVPHQIDGGWSVEYGRPDLGYMLREWATGGSDGRGVLGRRTAVFVCGPASMRVGVANTVARLQAEIWGDDMLEEIFLHTENYAL